MTTNPTHSLLTPEQLSALGNDLAPLARDHGEALLGDARDYLAADASKADLAALEAARADVLACEARAVIAIGDEKAAAERTLAEAESILKTALDSVRLSEEFAREHAAGRMFETIKDGIKAAAPVLLDAGVKIARMKLGA